MSRSIGLERSIVQFIHPGREFCPPAHPTEDRAIWDDERRLSGVRSWNCEKLHKHKFLVSKGMYRESPDGRDVESLLSFWGEWEPQSRFRRLADPPPFYVHEPFLVRNSSGAHNTDPFVFGPEFWYTNCQQPNNRLLLTNLSRGSLIIFGTLYPKRGGFALDTVFVVGERFRPHQYLDDLGICPEQLRLTTLDHANMAQENQTLIFYRGARPIDGMPFSFVPCCRVDNRDVVQGHGRVVLRREKFGLLGKRQGCGRLARSDVREFWEQIAQECRDQGFLMGHSVDCRRSKRSMSEWGTSNFLRSAHARRRGAA